MKKTLDFNSIERPVIELKMRDDAHTVINVTTVTERLVEKLGANGDAIVKASKGGNAEAIKSVYTLMAEVVNCNLEGITVTAEELRDKYGVMLEDAIMFFNVYLDFIDEIKKAKN